MIPHLLSLPLWGLDSLLAGLLLFPANSFLSAFVVLTLEASRSWECVSPGAVEPASAHKRACTRGEKNSQNRHKYMQRPRFTLIASFILRAAFFALACPRVVSIASLENNPPTPLLWNTTGQNDSATSIQQCRARFIFLRSTFHKHARIQECPRVLQTRFYSLEL